MAEQLITVAEGLHRWWTKPPPSSLLPKPTAPGKSAEDKRSASRTVPPFDIQQIPDAMDRLRLPVSARMMRHWFAGRANYSRTNDDLIAGIDQDGKPYAPDIIDQRIIDFDWVMQFARARKAHDELLPELIHSPKSLAKIADKVLAYMACRIRPFSAFNGLSVSNKNVHELHRDFQFQLSALIRLLWTRRSSGLDTPLAQCRHRRGQRKFRIAAVLLGPAARQAALSAEASLIFPAATAPSRRAPSRRLRSRAAGVA